MHARRWLVAIWICFVARGFFYCAALPLWEGFDEWSHFGVVQRMAFRGEALVSRDSPLPRDTAASLDLVPLAWELRNLPAPAVTHDAFWRLPVAERERRDAALRAIPPGWGREDSAVLKTYEGLQGPLYGWVMAPLLFAAGGAQLATQVLLLRSFGVVLVSLIVPCTFLVGRILFRSAEVALGCAAIVAAMPGLLIAVAHVSNESVSVGLFALLTWLAVRISGDGLTPRLAVALGVTLGLGLLAKAYFVTALPPVALLLAWRFRKDGTRLVVAAPICTAAIAGWWYVRNLVTTGSASGMLETAALPNATLGDQLHAAAGIHWGVVIDSILFSHLWLGSWSTLTVRSWMYHVLYGFIVLAAAGLAWGLWGRGFSPVLPRLAMLLLFFAVFWIAQLYHAITLFMVWGIATSLGAYLCAVTTAEVVLCVAGLRAIAPRAVRSLVAPLGVALFALLDLYTMHFVALPYYTGLIAHRPNGPLEAFHPGGTGLGEILARLAMFKSSLLSQPLLAAMWIAYLLATFCLFAIAVFTRSREKG